MVMVNGHVYSDVALKNLVGGFEPWNFMFHFIYGMSSQPH